MAGIENPQKKDVALGLFVYPGKILQSCRSTAEERSVVAAHRIFNREPLHEFHIGCQGVVNGKKLAKWIQVDV
jgi:hypothetical protein